MDLNSNDNVQKIIDTLTYKTLADYAGVSPSTAKQWKTGEKDWRKSKFESIVSLIKNYEDGLKMEGFNAAVEKYGKFVKYEDAISEIFENLSDGLEIGDTQDYVLSGAQSNGNSVSFEFEVVAINAEGLPELEFNGIVKEH